MAKSSVLSVRNAAVGLSGALASGVARAELGLNMPFGVTEVAHETYKLHMLMFWVCVAIGVVVFGVMFYSLFAHRRSKHPRPANFHESTSVEVAWTVVPFLILIAVAIPAAAVLVQTADTRNADMTIKVTGYQWLWHYDYLDQGVDFYSRLDDASNRARILDSELSPYDVPHYLLNVDNPVVLPVGKKVRILITSGDVIHSWWVPALAIKKDAVPGYINAVWTEIQEPGIYRGQCTELCGADHAFMPVVVKAVPVDEYEAWVESQGGQVSWPGGDEGQNAPETAGTTGQAPQLATSS